MAKPVAMKKNNDTPGTVFREKFDNIHDGFFIKSKFAFLMFQFIVKSKLMVSCKQLWLEIKVMLVVVKHTAKHCGSGLARDSILPVDYISH